MIVYEKSFRLGGILKGGKEISNSKAVFFFIYIEEGICGGNGENFLKS